MVAVAVLSPETWTVGQAPTWRSFRASPPVGCNGHANGGWAGAKSGARSRVPATPPPKTLRLPAPCTPAFPLQAPANPKFGTIFPAAERTSCERLVQISKTRYIMESFSFAVKNGSRQGSGSGSVFGVNGPAFAVAASPVDPKPGQSTWFPPLAYASQPTVEMLSGTIMRTFEAGVLEPCTSPPPPFAPDPPPPFIWCSHMLVWLSTSTSVSTHNL
jgi:hypothetical protein